MTRAASQCPCDGLAVVLQPPGTPAPSPTPDAEVFHINASGIVVDRSDGHPIANATIEFGGSCIANTDADGRFWLPCYNLARHGTLYLNVHAPEYLEWEWYGTTNRCPCQSMRVELVRRDAGPTPSPTSSQLTFWIRGYVRDALDDRPVVGALVDVRGAFWRDTTDDTGWFDIQRPGVNEFARVTIDVTRDGYQPWTCSGYANMVRCPDWILLRPLPSARRYIPIAGSDRATGSK
jgi:hypothetical protein